MGEALLAALDPLDVLGEVDAGQILLEGLMRGRLAGEQEVPALREHRLAPRLAGIEVVAKIHRIEPGPAGAVPSKPAPHGAAPAVLLVVPVWRPDELRGERPRVLMAGRDDGGRQESVEVLGGLASTGAGRAVRAVDLGRAVVLGAIQRDQHARAQALEGREPA